MPRNLALFLARLATNQHKDSFITRLGVTLLLGKFHITGALADVIGTGLRMVLGLMQEEAIFRVDLMIDALKAGMQLEAFERDAKIAYEKTILKIYDEEKKNEIRQEYLRIISAFGPVGNPK
jgi:hypothetical protein